MSQQLSDAVRSLERAKEKATQRLAEIDRERVEIKTSLKSLEMALRALSAGEPSKSAPTTAIVTESMVKLLTQHRELSVEELSVMVGKDLAEQGKSRAGLKLRFSQAVKDPRFVVTGQQIRLHENHRNTDE